MLDHILSYHYATSLEDAVAVLARSGSKAAVIAGGTDLVARRAPGVETLVDISRLGLDVIREDGATLRLGACATIQRIADDPRLATRWSGLLPATARGSAGRLIRNAATVGGQVMGADPAHDLVAALLAVDARVVLRGAGGPAEVPLDEFLARRFEHAAPGTILTEVILPAPAPATGAAFEKLARSEGDAGVATAAARVTLRDGRLHDVRLVLGCVAERPLRARDVEQRLEGRAPEADAVEGAVAALRDALHPPTDVRATAEYRREMAVVLAGRALRAAAEAAAAKER